MKRVLFIDIRNATRSQMAEAWLNQLGEPWVQARSCGTMPANRIDGRAVEVMREAGIDIHTKFPKSISQQRMNWADIVVVFGTGIYPRAMTPTQVWNLDDSIGKPIDQVRVLRDEIRKRVEALLVEIQKEEWESIRMHPVRVPYLQEI
jgi:protein-tyrosine-phosphatase